jgi:GTP-binding protein
MDLRNIAIIAHVDHGKTTLVDELLRQSGAFRENQAVMERAMDSNDLERERGITILAKATSVEWRGVRINIVDTPGHADFGGEVERILSMVDGVVLLVDAAEGPMPQTKFVTSKALRMGLRPIVVLNKVDRPDAEPDRALDEVFDLFVGLDASEEQLDFPILYASGRSGWADDSLEGARKDLSALFERIVAHVPPPRRRAGRRALRDARDDARRRSVPRADPDRADRERAGRDGPDGQGAEPRGRRDRAVPVSKVLAFRGLARTGIDVAEAGDIVSLAGMAKATVADTICDIAVTARRSRPSRSTRRRSRSRSGSTTARSRGATATRCSPA